jgi:ubiquinone/menaquinone biosynthesis C-methylase UbiE
MYDASVGQFANPTVIATHFHLREGDRIADFGAGSGHYMKPLSKAVGRTGVVYMCEIQKPLVEALGAQAVSLRLNNVRTVWADIEVVGGTKLYDGGLDAALLSNTLFQVSDKTSLFKEVARTLRKGGKLFVIDWAGSFAGVGPRTEQVVPETETRTLAEKAGFVYERSFPAGENHYGIALRKQ